MKIGDLTAAGSFLNVAPEGYKAKTLPILDITLLGAEIMFMWNIGWTYGVISKVYTGAKTK